jgi:hypothetical protein
METLTREEIEMCEIAVRIVTDTRTMTDDNMAKWDLLLDKLEHMQKEAAAQHNAHPTLGESATSQAVSNAETLSTSDGVPPSAPARVA